MAYDRYDTRGGPRDDRSRWSSDRFSDRDRFRERGRDDDRGFLERAGDEISSWFGDDDSERRRERDRRTNERASEHRFGPERERDQPRSWDRDRLASGERHERFDRSRDEGGSRPMAGDYGRGEDFFAAGSIRDERDFGRSSSMDPHYHSWRQSQLDELDRDYDDYRRENQARFDDDFTKWRGRRQQKRGLLGQIREHMDVVGNDDEHVGTIDRAAGDRIILTKSDAESGGVHHSLSCSDIDRVEGDRVILDCSAEQAKQRWRDESRSRALFEREDQGEMGPRMLDRSFEGTYR